jgi:hypothetical protein
MTIYKIITNDLGKCLVRNNEDGSVTTIPTDPANSDYQAYLNKDTLPSELSIPSTPQAGA